MLHLRFLCSLLFNASVIEHQQRYLRSAMIAIVTGDRGGLALSGGGRTTIEVTRISSLQFTRQMYSDK